MAHSGIKKLLLGITGGIAAYKAAELVRLLIKQDVDVQVVMTRAACQFITPATLQALSGKPVFTDMWDPAIQNGMPHIDLSREVDAILIAPASADFIAKLAQGHADDLLSTLCLARDCPLFVAPAMNRQMWEYPATQRNIALLAQDGVGIWGPASGEQACGEIGQGRMLEPEALLAEIMQWSDDQPFKGKNILITAGPTVELIDPVRALTNFSSGKMGYQIASVATALGANVTLISGPTQLARPQVAALIGVTSAQEMYTAVMAHISRQDIFISVAAVADYRPTHTSQEKIKKTGAPLSIELTPNPDILKEVANLPDAPFCVGFAAESENLLEFAEQKRRNKRLPLIVANVATESLGQDAATITLLDDAGQHPLPTAPKKALAHMLLMHVAAMLNL